MSKELKPTDKEYIEALAEKHWDLEHIIAKYETTKPHIIIDFTTGYQLALEHTNHVEVLEHIKLSLELIRHADYVGAMVILKQVVEKAEANKLNTEK